MAALKPPDERPSGQELAQMIQALIAQGYRGQDLASRIRAGMTREQNAQALIQMQREAERAQP